MWKIQEGDVEMDWDGEDLDEAKKRLEDMPEADFKFTSPEYHLVAVSKIQGKVTKIIWRSRLSSP